jgi:lipopolysaccharide/colanic/teichoic acid biosynthesis glycosyltransferase
MVKHSHRAYDVLKRVLDVAGAAFGLVVLSPVLLVAGVLVRSKLGSPVIFRQPRPGAHGRIFEIRKFRSMLAAPSHADLEAVQASDDDRLTPFGRRLRSTSIDELPELWNVLVGDMSIVGPRPLLPEYLSRYSPTQARRHEVRPGITGWAQVNGRNATSWEDRFAMDVWYVDNRSFMLDAKILWMTISAVLGRSGISAEGNATMPPFDPESTSDTADKEPAT